MSDSQPDLNLNTFQMAIFAHDYYILGLDGNFNESEIQFYYNFLLYNTYKDYQKQSITKAPVIRLFGTNEFSQKCCLHVHGYFPYFYIKINKILHLIKRDPNFLCIFITNLESLYSDLYDKQHLRPQKYNNSSIYNYEIVQKYDIYGYHSQKQDFLKIYVYDPFSIKSMQKILESKILMDINFQSYETHISYYMHFYGDCNIQGLNSVRIYKYRFRQNFSEEIMKLFSKFQIEKIQRKKINKFKQKMDVNQIFADSPFMFSSQIKQSSCYIEADCLYLSMINFIELTLPHSQSSSSVKESQEDTYKNQYKYQVQITKTLQNLWSDEANRRVQYGLSEEDLNLQIDLSKNFERKFDFKIGESDSLNIDMKYQNEVNSLLRAHLFQFAQQIMVPQRLASGFSINPDRYKSFHQNQITNEQTGKISAIGRFQVYKDRKKDLLVQLYQNNDLGDERQPRIDLENLYDEMDEQKQAEQDMIEMQQSVQKSYNQDKKQKKQDAFWRNNFKVNFDKRVSLKNTIFEICQYCKQQRRQCRCGVVISKIAKQTQEIDDDGPQYIYTLKYNKLPPKTLEILTNIRDKNYSNKPQYAYYDNKKDLAQHYNVQLQDFEQCQIFCRDMIKVQPNKLHSPGLINNQQLPYYYRINIEEEDANQIFTGNQSQTKEYLFVKRPPLLQQILKEVSQKNSIKMKNYSDFISPLKNTSIKTQQSQKEDLNQQNSISDITIFSFEIFAKSLPNMYANPEIDSIECLFYSVTNEQAKLDPDENALKNVLGMIIVDPINYEYFKEEESNLKQFYWSPPEINDIAVVESEMSLINTFIQFIIKSDPDIIAGYDMEKKSLSYLIERAVGYKIDILAFLGRAHSNITQLMDYIIHHEFKSHQDDSSVFSSRNMSNDFSRSNSKQRIIKQKTQTNAYGLKVKKKHNINAPDCKIIGRVILNVWRSAKHELNLCNYDLENVYFHITKIRKPVFDNWTLTQFYNQGNQARGNVFQYFISRLNHLEFILNYLEIIGRNIELTRLYGCEFESCLFRGSQFRIEAIISKVTKHNDFILLSATKNQVGQQKILECIPMVMEPPKLFYVDPIIVLDFQSLYPSIMIAYNYCFSTCLGNITEYLKGAEKRFGVKPDQDIDFSTLLQNKNMDQVLKNIFVAPNKVAYVRKNVREGIIPQVLHEFLSTRIMIKKSIKKYKNYPLVQKLLDFRQHGIKMFMNTTYGYIGASFTGRMPAGDVADSIVETGRFILQQVIDYINQHKEWSAKVQYGDTDSVFVLLKGRSMKEAFKIGQEMESEISQNYPYPITLKFEKVYESCVLVSKKRYSGYKYEAYNQAPEMQSKGIELVRRDGCPAIVKIMTKVLYQLFTEKNLSKIKEYLAKQWSKILNNHINVIDFIIAKEVTLGSYKALPAHAMVGENLEKKDMMRRPKFGERVKYLVIQGGEKDKVKDLVVDVEEFLEKNYSINAAYYIKTYINNPLQRIFSSMDIDIHDWYHQCDKNLVKKNFLKEDIVFGQVKSNIQFFNLEHYFRQNICFLCSQSSQQEICQNCLQNSRIFNYLIQINLNQIGENKKIIQEICKNCSQLQESQEFRVNEVPCAEFNCPILFERKQINDKYRIIKRISDKYINLMQDQQFNSLQ